MGYKSLRWSFYEKYTNKIEALNFGDVTAGHRSNWDAKFPYMAFICIFAYLVVFCVFICIFEYLFV